MLIAVDAGNHKTKVVTPNGAFSFLSALGEYRDRKLESCFGSDDMVVEYNREKMFAGTLAKKESEFLREMHGDTKAHADAMLRVLIAVHRYSNDTNNRLIVGQPISKHDETEKKKIKDMLTGEHVLTINGERKRFVIERVEISAEGAGAYFSTNHSAEKIHIIDVGSGTVNCATIDNGNYIDKESWTLRFGANTNKTQNHKAMAHAIKAKAVGKWENDAVVAVCGGCANDVQPHLLDVFENATVLKPQIRSKAGVKEFAPVFANAVGFYQLGRFIYE